MENKFYVGRVTVGKRPNRGGYYAYYRDSSQASRARSIFLKQ